jgi:serine/threonine protein kinase
MEGGDVQQCIRDRVNSGLGPLSEVLVLDWFVQIVNAIAHVHSKGLIHRDIKPANLFMSADHSKVIAHGAATNATP